LFIFLVFDFLTRSWAWHDIISKSLGFNTHARLKAHKSSSHVKPKHLVLAVLSDPCCWVWQPFQTHGSWVSQSCARPKVVNLAAMSDIIVLGLAAMTATNNVFFVEPNDVSSVLLKFRPLWLPENQDLCSFDLKTCFATLFFNPKTSIRHPINHETPFMV